MPPISLSHRRASLIARRSVMTANRALVPHLTDACLHSSSLVKCGSAPSERLLTACPSDGPRRQRRVDGRGSRRILGRRSACCVLGLNKGTKQVFGGRVGEQPSSAAHWREEAWDAGGHVPAPPSPHNLARSVPTQRQTHLRWQH